MKYLKKVNLFLKKKLDFREGSKKKNTGGLWKMEGLDYLLIRRDFTQERSLGRQRVGNL